VQVTNTNTPHISVLLEESIAFLEPLKNETFIDATLGLGGHTEAILSTGAKVIGIDQDDAAIQYSKKRLETYKEKFEVYQANFSEIKQVIEEAGIEKVDGILADLGVSSLQLDSESRGFSFRFNAPLDMRMNPESGGETVAELLKRLSEFDIARIIYEYGEEKLSRRIARRIVERRDRGEAIETTKELADICSSSYRSQEKIHPATRTFQALRIAVNGELEILEKFISDSVDSLLPNGRLVVISFHSLEDRIVKQVFQKLAGKCTCPPRFPICICNAEKKIEILTRKPVIPADSEMHENPRSRSAKLRACKKLI
jgi:16S rRNA (cytosine1402-N4)-methyltransferase